MGIAEFPLIVEPAMLNALPDDPYTPPPLRAELRVMKLCWMDTVEPVAASTPPPGPVKPAVVAEFPSIRQPDIVVAGAPGESTPTPAPEIAVFSVTLLFSRCR